MTVDDLEAASHVLDLRQVLTPTTWGSNVDRDPHDCDARSSILSVPGVAASENRDRDHDGIRGPTDDSSPPRPYSTCDSRCSTDRTLDSNDARNNPCPTRRQLSRRPGRMNSESATYSSYIDVAHSLPQEPRWLLCQPQPRPRPI
jgi:hypothetical protein